MVSKVCLKMKRKSSNINVVITDVDKSLSTDSDSFVVDEGDILLFPSMLLHEAPNNTSKVKRTVMAFNIPLR